MLVKPADLAGANHCLHITAEADRLEAEGRASGLYRKSPEVNTPGQIGDAGTKLQDGCAVAILEVPGRNRNKKQTP